MSSLARILVTIPILLALPCFAELRAGSIPSNTLVAVETQLGAKVIGTLSGIGDRDKVHDFAVTDRVSVPMRLTDDIVWHVSPRGVTAQIALTSLANVTTLDDLQTEFGTRARKANPGDPEEVQAVVEFGRSWGLTSQASAFLKTAWPKLGAGAGADPERQRALIEWALAHGLEESLVAREAAAIVADGPDRRDSLSDSWKLAEAYHKLGMVKAASTIRAKALASAGTADPQTLRTMLADLDRVSAPDPEVQTCQILLHKAWLKSATTAEALADLSSWCRQRGMAAEARAAAQKALQMSDEPAIHERLGEMLDPVTKKWVAPPMPQAKNLAAKRLLTVPTDTTSAVKWIRQWPAVLEVTVIGKARPPRFRTSGPGVEMDLEEWQVVNQSPVTIEVTPERGDQKAAVRLAPGKFFSTTGKRLSGGVRLAPVPTDRPMWALIMFWLGKVQILGEDGSQGPTLALAACFSSGDKSITAGWIVISWRPEAPKAE